MSRLTVTPVPTETWISASWRDYFQTVRVAIKNLYSP